ncbi:MAG TPA: DUF4349 domain-containing protein [Candidatus Limnocylindria bacterium]|nr:DUF4349 domain-containing protein [Candidatus Limnocylindria bacterium]
MTRRLFALLAVAALLVACGAQGGADFGDVGQPVVPGASAAAGGADGEAAPDEDRGVAGGGADDGSGSYAVPIEQRIVKTGEVTLEVASVAETLGRVRALVTQLSGYVGGSQAGTLDDSATITARIPAASFDDALARLHELDGEVIAEATREENVTTQIVDLGARIDNLEASEASYRELVARAEKIEDILAVQSRLDEVRGQIEQLTAQLKALEGQADLSTLTITLVPKAEPISQQAETWDPGAQLNAALAALVGIGQGLLNGLIWFGIVWLPILLILALLVVIALRGVLEVRRRMPAPRRDDAPA